MDQIKSQEQLELEQAMQLATDDRFTLTDDGDVTWALGNRRETIEQSKNS